MPTDNIQSHVYLDKIQQWTKDQHMELNASKTKFMVVNFTNNFKFNTRIKLEETPLEEVDDCHRPGLTITNQLSWNQNTEILVKKANTCNLHNNVTEAV